MNNQTDEFNIHIGWYKEGIWSERISQVIGRIENIQNSRILDIGCGIGTFTIEASKKDAKCVGLDPNNKAIEITKDLIKSEKVEKNAQVIRGSGIDLPFNDGSFDFVIMADIIEHIENPLNLLSEISRVLKKDGRLILATKNLGSIQLLFLNYFYCRDLSTLFGFLSSFLKIFKRRKSKEPSMDATKFYVGHVNEYDPFRLLLDLKRARYKILERATYSWNWKKYGSDKFFARVFQSFFSSNFYKKHIHGSIFDLILGHDIVVLSQKK